MGKGNGPKGEKGLGGPSGTARQYEGRSNTAAPAAGVAPVAPPNRTVVKEWRYLISA